MGGYIVTQQSVGFVNYVHQEVKVFGIFCQSVCLFGG